MTESKINNCVEDRLIFLISMPRSGSTLLQRILDQSSDISTFGEPWLMLPLLAMYDKNLIKAKYDQELCIMAKQELESKIGTNDLIENAQRAYADELYGEIISRSDKHYFLDKTPRYIYIVEKLSRLYPNAKFIVLIRNPAAIISSYAETWCRGNYGNVLKNNAFAHDFKEGFSDLSKFVKSDFSNKIIIKYEELISKPEVQSKRIFDYLGLDHNDEYINYNKENKLSKTTFGDPHTVYSKKRPDASHADKWLNTLSNEDKIKGIYDCLSFVNKDVFEKFGYNKGETYNNIEIAKKSSLRFRKEKSIRICICTPVFNGANTIDRTIRSIILQEGNFDIHYHVQDGGSTDGTIKKLQTWQTKIAKNHFNKNNNITFSYSSSPDKGMYHAISAAFKKIEIKDTDWMTWINADDFLSKNSFSALYDIDRNKPEVGWITGKCSIFSQDGRLSTFIKPHFSHAISLGLCDGIHLSFLQQEGTFWKGKLWRSVNGNAQIKKFRFAGDWNLWRLFSEKYNIYVLDESLGYFCRTPGQISESSLHEYYEEINNIIDNSIRNISLSRLDKTKHKTLFLSRKEKKLCSYERDITQVEKENFYIKPIEVKEKS